MTRFMTAVASASISGAQAEAFAYAIPGVSAWRLPVFRGNVVGGNVVGGNVVGGNVILH